MSLWPTRRAWAGLSPETPSSVLRVCAAIAVPLLCNEVLPYCSSSSSWSRKRSWHCVALRGISSWHFCICCFLKPKPLALVVSQWEQPAVSFFTVLQGNILQGCTSSLAEKVGTDICLAEDSALSLGWEDKNGGRGQSVSAGRVWFSDWVDSIPPNWK